MNFLVSCQSQFHCVKSFTAVGSSSCPVPQLKETMNSWPRETQIFGGCHESDLVCERDPVAKLSFLQSSFPSVPTQEALELKWGCGTAGRTPVSGEHSLGDNSWIWNITLSLQGERKLQNLWLALLLHFIMGFSRLLCTWVVSCLVRSGQVIGKCWAALWGAGYLCWPWLG